MTTALEAGRETDARVAEVVMGWEVCSDMKCQGCDAPVWRHESGEWFVQPNRANADMARWSPSTDIGAAWSVVDRVRESESVWSFHIQSPTRKTNGQWVAEVVPNYAIVPVDVDPYTAFADTAPLAIVRAALAAMGERDEEAKR